MRYLILVAFVLLIAGCTSQPCTVQSEQFIQDFDAIMSEWTDAEMVAQSTPRVSLPPVVSELQEIRRRADNELTPPDCAADLKPKILEFMDATIDLYLAFMANESDGAVSEKMQAADAALNGYSFDMAALKNGDSPYN